MTKCKFFRGRVVLHFGTNLRFIGDLYGWNLWGVEVVGKCFVGVSVLKIFLGKDENRVFPRCGVKLVKGE